MGHGVALAERYHTVLFKIDGVNSVRVFTKNNDAIRFMNENNGTVFINLLDETVSKGESKLSSNRIFIVLFIVKDTSHIRLFSNIDNAQDFCKTCDGELFEETINRGLNELKSNNENTNIETNISRG